MDYAWRLLDRWLGNPVARKAVFVLVVLLVIGLGVRLLKTVIRRYVVDAEARYRARKVVVFLGYVFAILSVAFVFSDRAGGFALTLGVAGAGIAFALQEVIASFAGWVAISFGGFYNPGDRIQLGGIRGDVIDIGILRTTLMECGQWVAGDLYNGRIVRVANSFVFKEPVFNYSGDFPFLWDEIMVPIKYGSDYKMAREIIQRVADEVVGSYSIASAAAWKAMVSKYLVEEAKVEPTVTLVANQNWIELTLRYVVDFKVRRGTKDRLFTRILEEIDKVPGKVGIAAATLNIEKFPPLEVRFPEPVALRKD